MGETKKIETDAKGIPLKGAMSESTPVWIFYTVINVVFGAMGLAVAYFAAYATKTSKADAQIATLAGFDFGWLYLGIVVLKILQLPLGVTLGEARQVSKIHLPDQHVYKVMGAEGSKLGFVLMETEGVLGDFNRAQRALMNYHEIFPTTALLYVAASFVFPFEAFWCATVWAVSRVMMAYGYKGSVNGRMLGSVIGVVAQGVLQGMVLIVSYKALA
jgi:hypothetical protein